MIIKSTKYKDTYDDLILYNISKTQSLSPSLSLVSPS